MQSFALCLLCFACAVQVYGVILLGPASKVDEEDFFPLKLRIQVKDLLNNPNSSDSIAAFCASFSSKVRPNEYQFQNQLKNPLQDEVVKTGAHSIVLNGMRQFPNDTELQSQCADFFSNLVLWNPRLGIMLGNEGVIEVLTSSCKPTGSCGAISPFVDFLPAQMVNLHRVVASGAVESMLQNIRNNPQNQGTASSTAFFFCNICASPEAQAAMVENGWGQLSVDIMRNHPYVGGVRGELIWDNDRCFTNTAEHRNMLADTGFLEETIKLMRDCNKLPPHDKTFDVLYHTRTFQNSLDMITKCANNNATQQSMLVEYGAAEVIADGIQMGLTDRGAACPALKALGKDKGAC